MDGKFNIDARMKTIVPFCYSSDVIKVLLG